MNSEKIKEIKKALEKVTEKHCTTYLQNGRNCKGCENIELNYCDKRLALLTLTLINELESELEKEQGVSERTIYRRLKKANENSNTRLRT